MRKLFENLRRIYRIKLRSTLRNSTFGAGCRIEAGSKVIGCAFENDVYIGPECRLFAASVGPYSSIGPRVTIGENEHQQTLFSTSDLLLECIDRVGYAGGKNATTAIGPDVWIGANAFIRKGVHIGAGAIVGAHAVVVRDVPAYAIVVGTPAKVLRFRFEEAVRQRLEESKWWRLDRATLQRAITARYGSAQTDSMSESAEILAFLSAIGAGAGQSHSNDAS